MSKNQKDSIKKLKARVWNLFSGQGNPNKIKALEIIINIPDDKFEFGGLIDQRQATNKDIPDVYEEGEKKIVVVFENYNQTQCELCKLDEVSARALTSKLKYLTSIAVKDLSGSGLIRGDVHDDGDYSGLYSNLEQDITLKEIEFAGEGRFFGFFKNEFFSLIAIWVKHANLH